MNNLLMLACKSENIEIIKYLIRLGIDPLTKNKYGNTCLHLSTYHNNFCCVGTILSYYEALNEQNKIKEILNIQNDDGDTVLHIAAKYNYINLTLLFISYQIRNNIKINFTKNNSGLTPIQLAIKNHNFTIPLIYIKFYELDYSSLLSLKNLEIEDELESFLYSYDSKFLDNEKEMIEEKFKGISYFKNEKEHADFDSKKIDEELKEYKSYNYDFFQRNKI